MLGICTLRAMRAVAYETRLEPRAGLQRGRAWVCCMHTSCASLTLHPRGWGGPSRGGSCPRTSDAGHPCCPTRNTRCLFGSRVPRHSSQHRRASVDGISGARNTAGSSGVLEPAATYAGHTRYPCRSACHRTAGPPVRSKTSPGQPCGAAACHRHRHRPRHCHPTGGCSVWRWVRNPFLGLARRGQKSAARVLVHAPCFGRSAASHAAASRPLEMP